MLAPVEEARAFVATMRGVALEPVHYLELPGTHHAFEYYNSRRNLEVADTVVRFLSGVRGAPFRETVLG